MTAIFQAMNEALLVLDKRGRVIFANAAAARELQQPVDHLLGQPLHHLPANPLASQLNALWQEARAPHSPNPIEQEFSHAGRPLRLRALPLEGHWLLLWAESSLTTSEARMRTILEALPTGVLLTDAQGRVIYSNPAGQRIWAGVPHVALHQYGQYKSWWYDTGQPIQADQWAAARTLRTGEPVIGEVIEIEAFDGTHRILHISTVPIRDTQGKQNSPDKITGVVIVDEDITPLIRAEQELRESEQRLRFTLQAAHIATWDWDLDTHHVRWSDNFAAVHGMPHKHYRGTLKNFLQDVYPPDRRKLIRAIRRARTHHATIHVDYRHRHTDGSLGWITAHGRVIQDTPDRRGRLTGVCMDITQRRHAEDQVRLRAGQQQMVAQLGQLALTEPTDRLLEHAARRVARALRADIVGLFEMLPDGQRLQLKAGVGWRPGCVGQTVVEVLPGSLPAYALQTRQPVVARDVLHDPRFTPSPELRTHGVVSTLGVLIATPDGQPYGAIGAYSKTERAFSRDDIHFLQTIAHLLAAAFQRQTHERQLQQLNATLEQRVAERTAESRRRADQLQMLAAELTETEQRERRRLAKLLHDHLQQLLVAIKMRIAAALPASDEEASHAMAEADEMLSQAIDASRSLSIELAPAVLYEFGLGQALEWLARWMRQKHGLQVELITDKQPDNEPEQIRVLLFEAVRELLLNVIKHAHTNRAQVTLQRQPQLWQVIVEDFGRGFDPHVAHTKGDRSGYGLLSLQERLKLMGGHVQIDSAPGQGTRVQLSLPLRRPAPATSNAPSAETSHPATPDTPAPDDTPPHRITIMLTDDHEVVRRGLAEVIVQQPDLQLVGQATSGEQALQLARELRPEVVVMDLSLPGISGIEATRRLIREWPDIHVIGLSIHDAPDVTDILRSAGAAAFLNKAQPASDLIRTIRQVARHQPAA